MIAFFCGKPQVKKSVFIRLIGWDGMGMFSTLKRTRSWNFE
jgi:hypothetical protein